MVIFTQERGNGEKEDMGSTRRVQPAGMVRRKRSQKPNEFWGKGSDVENLRNKQKGSGTQASQGETGGMLRNCFCHEFSLWNKMHDLKVKIMIIYIQEAHTRKKMFLIN